MSCQFECLCAALGFCIVEQRSVSACFSASVDYVGASLASLSAPNPLVIIVGLSSASRLASSARRSPRSSSASPDDPGRHRSSSSMGSPSSPSPSRPPASSGPHCARWLLTERRASRPARISDFRAAPIFDTDSQRECASVLRIQDCRCSCFRSRQALPQNCALEHFEEPACPRPDPGWNLVFRPRMRQSKTRCGRWAIRVQKRRLQVPPGASQHASLTCPNNTIGRERTGRRK
jgi:hypothetical protein